MTNVKEGNGSVVSDKRGKEKCAGFTRESDCSDRIVEVELEDLETPVVQEPSPTSEREVQESSVIL